MSPELNVLRSEKKVLRQVVAELTLKNQVQKKPDGFGTRLGCSMKYSQAKKYKIFVWPGNQTWASGVP